MHPTTRFLGVLPLISELVYGAALKTTSKTFTDTFEDKPKQPLGLELGSAVGIENGIFYNGWAVGTATASILSPNGFSFGGIAPESPVNVALSDVLIPNGTTTLTRDYEDSKVVSFDLKELFYGCSIVDGTGIVSDVVACSLTAYGYYKNGTKVPEHTFSWAVPFTVASVPGEATAIQAMHRLILPSHYVGLRNVTFALVSTQAESIAATAFQVDNVTHTNYYSS